MHLNNTHMVLAKIAVIVMVVLFPMSFVASPMAENKPVINPDGSLNWQRLFQIGQKCSGGLPNELLLAIIWVESTGRKHAINVNGGGSYFPRTAEDALRIIQRYNTRNIDIGLMQVNWRWWGEYFNVSPADLLKPDINICIGSRILRQYLDEYGWSWRGIGRYNATSRDRQIRYAKRVNNKLQMIRELQQQ